jgi:hypothetical protein
MDNTLRLLAVAAGALMLMAAQTPAPRNFALDTAREMYLMSRADPAIAQAAPVELRQARQTLRMAEKVWADGRDDGTTRALARMAVQQVEHARQVSAGANAAPNPPMLQADVREPAARPAPGQLSSALAPLARPQPQPVRLSTVR